jgi:hypothetical protein
MKPRRRLLKAALRYARSGWPVLPVHSAKSGRCSCRNSGCTSAGKHPRNKHGVKDATTDRQTIRKWWGMWPDANVGVATGKESGILVLDIDSRHDGPRSLKRLSAKEGPIPLCPVANTGGGGQHLVFEYPSGDIKNRTSLRPGIDVRADGGYIVAPPSRHVSGKRYLWRTNASPSAINPPAIPRWLLKLMLGQSQKMLGGGTKRVPSGQRNSFLTSLAGAMRRRGASEETLVAALLEENEQRCETPLSDDEVKKIAASVSKYPPADEAQPQERNDALLRTLLPESAKFFHNRERDAFATFKVGDHRETFDMRDANFRRYLAAQYYAKSRKTISGQKLRDVVATLEGIALYESPQREVFTRVAPGRNSIYLDLCNDAWQVVEITSTGWRVVSRSPIKFRRSRGMRGLPTPERGGSIDDLRRFLNVSGKSDFIVIASWLIAALRPKGPYPVLVLQGEAGSAKSTAVRVLRELVDPNTTPLRSEPRSTRDLMIAARNSWCIAFDNVSHLRPQLSDDLCRLATGGGFATRQLYTDTEEILFDASRPIILNGIDAVVYRGDLLDRSLLVFLPVIPDDRRETEKQFWLDFKKAKPKVLGTLLDAVVQAMRRIDSISLTGFPRMADFAQWAAAAAPALGWEQETFLDIYRSNRGTAVALGLEASAIVIPLNRFLLTRNFWRGSAAELLSGIRAQASDHLVQQYDWPKNAQILSSQLRRIAPQLRAVGLDVHFGEKTAGTGSKRIIRIRRRSADALSPAAPLSNSVSETTRRFRRLASGASDAESTRERRARRKRRIRGES